MKLSLIQNSIEEITNLTQEEVTLLRKANGKINWVAGITIPEISYHVCQVSARVKHATTADVHTISKVIKYIKNTPSHITGPVLDLGSSAIQLYFDISFNNLPDSGRKEGM